jgi:hypothetical protein
MDFVNETNMPAGWTLGFEPDGRELVVVIAKATFQVPRSGETPQLAGEQLGLTQADEFTGEPGLSAPLRETDYAHRKPACDVLLNGTAYVQSGRSESAIPVGLRVGSLVKTFTVVGDRIWRRGLRGIHATAPEGFAIMPISYDNAFGGVDRGTGDATRAETYLDNPVGRGYSLRKEDIDGLRLPNTEASDETINDPSAAYRPMSFGPVGRNWKSRVKFAGTYDGVWVQSRAPFWPDDFDYHYFQAAPVDQQVPFLTGGELVVMHNLTPDGRVEFTLPKLDMAVLMIPYRGGDREISAQVDTLLLEPDLGLFTVTWRTSVAMRKSCFDLKRVVVGKVAGWRRAESAGKPYYKGLAELARARRGLS